jgi:photosystem II stability/assembly factor-like uncharacterized protein
MARSWMSVVFAFLLVFAATVCFSQDAPSQGSGPGTSAAAPAASQSAVPEDDDDSPDIPPFARSRTSEKQYLELRDQQLRLQRGLDDLVNDPQARSRAIRTMQLQEQSSRRMQTGSGVSGPLLPPQPAWAPLGPAPIPNGQIITGPSVSVSGRVTAIAIDPTDVAGDIVYVGTAQGGLYRTLDGGSTWTALMDTANSLAIGAITIDPTDHTIVFVGTGESSLSLDSFFGVGLYIITGANTTPVLNGPFNSDGVNDVFTGRSISKILVNPGNHSQILVSTSSGFSGASGDTFNTLPTRGVYLSTNVFNGTAVGTPTFTRQSIQSVSINRLVSDMVMDPGNPNLVLVHVFGTAAAGDGGVWVSPSTVWSGTGTWMQTLMDNAGNGNSADNARFAVNRVGSTTTFLLALDQTVASGTCSGKSGTLSSSVNGGSTWTELTAARGFCGGQCFYDMPVALDPGNASNIFIGGASGTTVGACGSSGLGKSTNGGASFAASETSLHADSHTIAIFPGNPSIMYEGNDGGVFRSDDGGATWTSRNTAGFNATQFESLAVHPSDPNFTIGGTQDNGTPFLQPSGVWTRADFGDGGFSAIDQNAADTTNVTMYHTYFNQTNNLVGFAQVTSVASASDGMWSFFGCGGTANGINCADTVLFYAPLALGPGNPNTVYYGSDRLYRSPDKGVTMTAVSQAPIVAGPPIVPVSAIGISPQDDTVRIVGLANGQVWATTSGSSTLANVTGGWTAKYIARTVIDPNAKFTAYVTLDGYGVTTGHVWKTTNLNAATPTWTAVSSGIPDVPVNAFVVDPANSSNLYAGTDIGVYNSTDGGAAWNLYGTGLPRVAVFDMKIAPNHKLRVATHGRGMWETAAVGINDDSTTLVPSPAHISPGTSVTLTATVNHGAIVTIPTGTVTFYDGTSALAAPVTLDGTGAASFSTSSLSSGLHNLTAVYSGDSNFRSSVSASAQVGVGALATATSLFAGPANPVVGATVTFTANVDTGSSQAVPTGTVSFKEGTTVLGTTTLSGSTVARFQTSSLSFGSHNITAQYAGDGTYAGSTSAAIVVNVVNPVDYKIDFPNGSQTVKAGASASYTVNVTTTGGFSGTINFACPSGLPSLTSCSFNPMQVTVSGNTGSTTLTISTTAPTAAPPAPGLNSGLLTGGGFLALGLALIGIAGKKRGRKSAFLLLGVLALAATLGSCGGKGTPAVTHNPGTPPGTYTVTVSATSGSTTHQSTITLVVQ